MIKLQASLDLTFEYSDGIAISLMKTGSALIKGVSTKEVAETIYNEIMNLVANDHESSKDHSTQRVS